MSVSYVKLYAATGAADSVYFLSEGSVYFYISNVDKYAISGSNLIIGATEIIMSRLLDTDTGRIETAVANGSSAVKKIPIDKFMPGLATYSFALNVAMVLAKQVLLTGQILQKNMDDLEGEEKKTREYAVVYYTIIDRLRQEYDKRRLPWLKDLIEEYGETLTNKKGEAYCKSTEAATMTTVAALSEMDVEYQRGSVICEENTPGSEMYILKSGAIDVIMKGSRISSIDQPGTVIGETALLLGEKRAATLKAKNTVVLTRIRKENLKSVAEKQRDFLTSIATTLARRHYYNVARIEAVNKSLAEQIFDKEAAGGDKRAVLSHRAHQELTQLKNRLEDVVMEKKADFLNDLMESL
jgi:CRP-like cAMP-binding protein